MYDDFYNDDEQLKSSVTIGDDTNAFGRNWLKVNAPKGIDPTLIKKAVFQCGPLQHVETNPTFPYYINFQHFDTLKLLKSNECSLMIFDSRGLRVTLEGSFNLIGKKQKVIYEGDNNVGK